MLSDGICRFYELKKGEEVKFSVNETTAWMKDIIAELEDGVNAEDVSELAEGTITFEGYLKKGTGGKFGEYLMLNGELKSTYRTLDVQTGEPMHGSLNINVRICCIDDENKEKFELEEELIIYLEDEEYDLFFFDGKKASVAEIVREIVIVEKDDYPVKDAK